MCCVHCVSELVLTPQCSQVAYHCPPCNLQDEQEHLRLFVEWCNDVKQRKPEYFRDPVPYYEKRALVDW